jgi:hypothetical protein
MKVRATTPPTTQCNSNSNSSSSSGNGSSNTNNNTKRRFGAPYHNLTKHSSIKAQPAL